MCISEGRALHAEATADAKDPQKKHAQKKEKEASVVDEVDQGRDEIRR